MVCSFSNSYLVLSEQSWVRIFFCCTADIVSNSRTFFLSMSWAVHTDHFHHFYILSLSRYCYNFDPTCLFHSLFKPNLSSHTYFSSFAHYFSWYVSLFFGVSFLVHTTTGYCRHCGLVVTAPACDGTGCEFDSWRFRIYIPCSLSLRLLELLRGSLGTYGLTQKLCLTLKCLRWVPGDPRICFCRFWPIFIFLKITVFCGIPGSNSLWKKFEVLWRKNIYGF